MTDDNFKFIIPRTRFSFILKIALVLSFFTFTPSKAESYRLYADSETATYEKSNRGILGVKYLHQKNKNSVVISVYPNTPAERAGIQVGDQIIAVDGINVMPYDADHVFTLIDGLPGSPVTLSMLRCTAQCKPYQARLVRMDMNELNSDNIFKIYKYGL
ncbi:MAG: PDZ domain-containing protein [Proteobacteria bacterium]|jgi:C-terminal processing protease CtpA/Prc|nr:PDZ domain-containing protein [Pseudomonadota bacterium]